jgi:hypothetical protein
VTGYSPGMTDLNNTKWTGPTGVDLYCVEIAEDFQSGQGTPGAYIFRPGFESAKKVRNRTEWN